jgi:hypothetical protein
VRVAMVVGYSTYLLAAEERWQPIATLVLEMDAIKVFGLRAERERSAGIVLMSSVGKSIIKSAQQLARVL